MPIKTDNEYCLNFAANVRYLISLSGKQQQEVAADLGISTTAFNNYLVGRNLPHTSTSTSRTLSVRSSVMMSFSMSASPLMR